MSSPHCFQGRRHATCPLCNEIVVGKEWTGRRTIENIVTGGVQHKKCFLGGLTQKQYVAKLRNN